jgi:hypothetical protein
MPRGSVRKPVGLADRARAVLTPCVVCYAARNGSGGAPERASSVEHVRGLAIGNKAGLTAGLYLCVLCVLFVVQKSTVTLNRANRGFSTVVGASHLSPLVTGSYVWL